MLVLGEYGLGLLCDVVLCCRGMKGSLSEAICRDREQREWKALERRFFILKDSIVKESKYVYFQSLFLHHESGQ